MCMLFVLSALPFAGAFRSKYEADDTTACSPLWGQCGGFTEDGSKWSGATCCKAGSKCMRMTEYYSQCTDGAAPRPAPAPSPRPSPPPSPRPTPPPAQPVSGSGPAAEGASRFPKGVLQQLAEAMGITSGTAWANVWGIIAKSEHNRGPADWDLSDDGKTPIFYYASALSYDWKDRGVTLGCVGFTTANSGKAEWGDAQALFRQFKEMGGPDLLPYCSEAHKQASVRDKLIAEIRKLSGNVLFVQAQFAQLLKPSGYIGKSMELLRNYGFRQPSALSVAALFDHSLNCGSEGQDGGIALVSKIPKGLSEPDFLRKFSELRCRVLNAKNNYNSNPTNGLNRCKIITSLLDDSCLTLESCDAAVRKAIGYSLT